MPANALALEPAVHAVAASFSPTIAQFHAYWRSKWPGEDRLPGRRHIDPVEIPDLLPGIYLLDVVHMPDGRVRFRYRLLGTRHVEMSGVDPTGRFVDEAPATEEALVRCRHCDAVLRNGEPQHWTGRVPVVRHGPLTCEQLVVPLATDGRTVDMLFGIAAWRAH